MKNIYYTAFIIAFCATVSSTNVFAQCKTFTKKQCLPDMSPYIHDGQVNSTAVSEGESIELYKTFYEGQDYRVLVCVSEELESKKVRVRLLDHNRKVLYDNQDYGYIEFWDFVASSTQQVIVEVSVLKIDDEKTEVSNGCAAILVGFLNADGFIKK